MRVNSNIEKLEVVAGGLGEIMNQVVFVGGAVASLYMDDPAALYFRPTIDIDCIIQFTSRREFAILEEKLRAKGFRNDTSDDAPICRWIFNDIPVDIMPTDFKILGFSNKWYDEGISNLIKRELPSGIEISILDLPYFIATKIEAFHGRSESDFRISHDIEDIIIVLDGLLSFEKINFAPLSVKEYLIDQFREFLKKDLFVESVSTHIEQGQSPARTKRMIDFFKNFTQ